LNNNDKNSPVLVGNITDKDTIKIKEVATLKRKQQSLFDLYKE
jgi:hypothetical protein